MSKKLNLAKIARELEALDVAHRVRIPDLDLSFECLNSLVAVALSTRGNIHDREAALERAADLLEELLSQLLPRPSAVKSAQTLILSLPKIKRTLLLDAKFTHASDPAATSVEEVLISYPGLRAIATHRIASVLFSSKIPIIPRLFSEFAHGATGIDIHPGATIEEEFCIDHGTGIVIGETCQIGRRVKIFQGVTLGALSVSKSSAQKKRHPTVEDEVVVYANATILGGKTTIGKGSIIGGNVWLTHSVPANSKVYVEEAPTVK